MNIGNIDLTKDILLIAEIGSNHGGDIELALEMVEKAAKAGADAVKFQTYQAEELVRKDLPAAKHVASQYKYQYERFKALEFTEEQYLALHKLCQNLGCMFLCTPFDKQSADMLDPLVNAFKVASGDINHLPLLRHLSKKGKPVFLSTGMANDTEIGNAIKVFGKQNVILLHCISKYPTLDQEANLLSIPYLHNKFEILCGYSDHTIGISACVVAATLGAVVIEKHFTLDKTINYGDHKLSADPTDFENMATQIKKIKLLLGAYENNISIDKSSRTHMRRGAVAAMPLIAGDEITMNKVKFVRPADGISPDRIKTFLGKKVNRDIKEGSVLQEDFFV